VEESTQVQRNAVEEEEEEEEETEEMEEEETEEMEEEETEEEEEEEENTALCLCWLCSGFACGSRKIHVLFVISARILCVL
jgi:hypothetical protein